MKKSIYYVLLLSASVAISYSCGKKGCTDATATNYDSEAKKDDVSCLYENNTTPDLSVLESKFYSSATTFSFDDNNITITSTGEPDHKSMYYPTSHALYEAYTESDPDFKQNPNSIGTQNFTFTIPRYPEEASTKAATDFGPMGVAANGVVFFNQEAAPGDDILDELWTFDQYEGHPNGADIYHNHTEPVYLTSTLGNDAFLGLLLDGHPVYGPYENGTKLTNDDLDDYHGHTSATAEFPNGIYHYHITDDLPWINGGQYYGTAGTVTN